MSNRPVQPSVMGADDNHLEQRLRQAAAGFAYPPTPDLAARERQRLRAAARAGVSRRSRRFVPALVLLGLALLTVLLVSPARARVLEWFRIGSVRIFYSQPTPTAAQPLPDGTTPGMPSGTPSPALPATPGATPTALNSVLDLAGETTLTGAQQQLAFTIHLPAYPSDVGPPKHVYLQPSGEQSVILVWMEPGHPEQVRMALSESLSEQSLFEKYQTESVLDTRVGDFPAVWIDGDYLLVMRSGDFSLARLISQGHTLIWDTGEMTFRMETGADLETAIRTAQSLR